MFYALNIRDSINMFDTLNNRNRTYLDPDQIYLDQEDLEKLHEPLLPTDVKLRIYLEDKFDDLKEDSQKQINRLDMLVEKSILQLSALEAQLSVARAEAESARLEAKLSKRQSIISICIAILAVIVALLAWIIPGESIRLIIFSLFQ